MDTKSTGRVSGKGEEKGERQGGVMEVNTIWCQKINTKGNYFDY